MNIFNKLRNSSTEDQTDQSVENNQNSKRLERIEKRVNLLVLLTSVQAIVLAILVVCLIVRQFMPSTLSLILMGMAICGFLYFFRAQVPGWVGNFSRYIFAQMFSAQKSDSMKDIK